MSEVLSGTTLLDNDQKGVPKAYLNYLLLDKNYKVIDQGFVQVSEAAEVKTGRQKRAKRKHAATDSASHETLSVDLNIQENGYLYTYVSNESNWDVDVFFDNMMVMAVAAQPAVVQTDDYYPFGLTHRQPLSNNEPNKYLYNGKELQTDLGLSWYDYQARYYDPATGRFNSVDPLADQMRRFSPYNYAIDNPIRFVDPDGSAPTDVNCPTCPSNEEFANALATDILSVKHSLYNTVARFFGYEATFVENEAGNYETGFVKTDDDFLTATGKYALDVLSVATFGRGGGPNAFLAKTPGKAALTNQAKNVVEGLQSIDDFINPHAYTRHKFDPSRVSSRSRTQYGKNINVKEIREQTINNADDVIKNFDDAGVHYSTTYKKTLDTNISTNATPTRESRVIINHLDPDKSTQFPYYKKGVTDEF